MKIRPWHEYTEHGQRYRIKAEGGLQKIGAQAPYFSLTGEIQRAEFERWGEDRCGCIHEELLKHWPELKPLALLHLSNMDGVPMHGGANGWYWMAGALSDEPILGLREQYHGANGSGKKSPDECLQIFAGHVRISLIEAQHLREHLAKLCAEVGHYQRVWENKGAAPAKAYLNEWVEIQKPRWKREAEQAIKDFDLKVYM